MTFKGFFTSDPGKATVALVVSAIFAIWPVAAGWVAASYALTFPIHCLRRSFARLEAAEHAERLRQLEEDQHITSGLQRLDGDASPSLRGNHGKFDTAELVAVSRNGH